MGVDPLYFLDDLSPGEAESMYKAHWEQVKIEWEKIRVLSFFTVIAHRGTKNYKKPTDLFTFTWEEQLTEKGERLTYEEAIKRAHEINLKKELRQGEAKKFKKQQDG